ncbi:hypothetical protein M9H77_19384 [Catharanthus roseus]|uniref:Uncharacterized protein n=1 Tax=Catharanthus roseus TaxID=4058 RepID=A0ACC0BA59_CATRO|nr:hypothetical protein M9H77_19384 [Catharanthus roseus]
MRFVDKIQAISAVQKWSIQIGREFRVIKKESNPWLLGDNQIHQRTHMPYLGYSKQVSKYDFKVDFKTNIASCCQQSGDPYFKHYPRSLPNGLVFDKFLRIELKSRDHTVTTYNPQVGIYMVKSLIRLDGRDNNVYSLKMNEKLYSCGKWQEYTLLYFHTFAVCTDNGTRPDAYVIDIYSQ